MKIAQYFFLATLIVTALPVMANVLVNVNGTLYDVSTITTSFDANAALLEAQADWGNESLASGLAAAVGTQLGAPNFSGVFGPFFAYAADYSGGTQVTTFVPFESNTVYGGQPGFADVTYALVTPAAVPEAPSALTSFALCLPFLCLFFQRFIGRRLKQGHS